MMMIDVALTKSRKKVQSTMNWKLWGLLFSQVACIQALAPLKKNIGFVLRERTALTKLIGGGGGEKKVAIKERN